MISRVKAASISYLDSVLNSYSQIFFSNNRIFAAILLLVTFFDVYAGISGLLSVIVTNIAATLIGFRKSSINSGLYGFNSLLVGLGIGIFYQFTPVFIILVVFASLFTLFLTLLLEGVIGKYHLPYLSVSFLIGFWMVVLAARQFSSLAISERGIYTLNEMYTLGGLSMVKLYNWFVNLNIPDSLVIYFRSLGAIFFQYHLFAGILIAIGLIIYSRIAFLLSLVGFYAAYLFYYFIGADIQTLSYSYIGFNFILTAIAVGGFFIIPSFHSFLWVVLLTPLLIFVTTSTSAFFAIFQLSIYSLPFNFIVILFLYALKFRDRNLNRPELVSVQQYSPEKNLYVQSTYNLRYNPKFPVKLSLPFWGKWTVTQGHDGEHTHKEEWRHAFDFEIADDRGETYSGTGNQLKDYYCFNKPVLAPADGWIMDKIDTVDDNQIGDVNLEQNWGNSVLIKHQENLYSQISHLKKDSIKVEKGDYVKKGQTIGSCGNSGRSPVPHIHFQVQEHPFIGSKTKPYPFGDIILHQENETYLKSYIHPQKDDIVAPIEETDALEMAYNFVPGQKMVYNIKVDGKEAQKVTWQVMADAYNNTFITCNETGSKAYFKNEKGLFQFTHFEGNKNTLLYYFFLGNFKIIKGIYRNMIITDTIPIYLLRKDLITLLHDFVAPFYTFLKGKYEIRFAKIEETLSNTTLIMQANINFLSGRKVSKHIDFEITIHNNRINSFEIKTKNQIIEAVWENGS